MVGTENSVKGVLTDLSMRILHKIIREPTRDDLIKIHLLISVNSTSVAPNIGGCQHSHLSLTITVEDYLDQMWHSFIPPHNPKNYPPMMEITQEQALGTETFRENQPLFWHCTAVDRAIKNKIAVVVQQLFLSPSMYQMAGLGQVTSLEILQHIFMLHRCDWWNIPWRKLSQDDCAIWHRRTTCPPYQPSRKWAVIFKISREEIFSWHDGVKGDQPIVANGSI